MRLRLIVEVGGILRSLRNSRAISTHECLWNMLVRVCGRVPSWFDVLRMASEILSIVWSRTRNPVAHHPLRRGSECRSIRDGTPAQRVSVRRGGGRRANRTTGEGCQRWNNRLPGRDVRFVEVTGPFRRVRICNVRRPAGFRGRLEEVTDTCTIYNGLATDLSHSQMCGKSNSLFSSASVMNLWAANGSTFKEYPFDSIMMSVSTKLIRLFPSMNA